MEITKNESIEQFGKLLTQGQESIYKACKILVQEIDADPENAPELFRSSFPTIPDRAWGSFEKIGRDMIDFRLMMGGSKNDTKIKKLPISTQRKIMDGDKLELLTSKGDTLLVDARTCEKEQADQLFDGDSVRTLSEQRAFIENKRRNSHKMDKAFKIEMPYKVGRGKVTVYQACEFTKGDLLRMLAEV